MWSQPFLHHLVCRIVGDTQPWRSQWQTTWWHWRRLPEEDPAILSPLLKINRYYSYITTDKLLTFRFSTQKVDILISCITMQTFNGPRNWKCLVIRHSTFGIIVRRGLPCPVVTDNRDVVGVVVLEDPLQTAVDARHIVTSRCVVLDVRLPYWCTDGPQVFLSSQRSYVRFIPM